MAEQGKKGKKKLFIAEMAEHKLKEVKEQGQKG